jgi:hypothetical protein
MRAWRDPFCYWCAAEFKAESRPIIPLESWQQEATRLLVNMALSHLRPGACNS